MVFLAVQAAVRHLAVLLDQEHQGKVLRVALEVQQQGLTVAAVVVVQALLAATVLLQAEVLGGQVLLILFLARP